MSKLTTRLTTHHVGGGVGLDVGEASGVAVLVGVGGAPEVHPRHVHVHAVQHLAYRWLVDLRALHSLDQVAENEGKKNGVISNNSNKKKSGHKLKGEHAMLDREITYGEVRSGTYIPVGLGAGQGHTERVGGRVAVHDVRHQAEIIQVLRGQRPTADTQVPGKL